MSDNWQDDLSDSARDFYNVVWPRINQWFGGGELLPVESVKASEMARHLDQLAGIDAWHIQKDNKRMRGVASRVQWQPLEPPRNTWQHLFFREWTYDSVWKTFTIRSRRHTGTSTELEKRLEQLNHNGGWLYPAITVQAYLKNKGGELIYACAIRTLDLYRAIQFHPNLVKSQVNSQDRNEFVYLNVCDLKDKGIEVKELSKVGQG